MSNDIWNALNTLITAPATVTGHSPLAGTTTVDAYVTAGAQAAFTYSSALTYATLEYVNEKGQTGNGYIGNDTDLHRIARGRYAYSTCDPLVVEITHS